MKSKVQSIRKMKVGYVSVLIFLAGVMHAISATRLSEGIKRIGNEIRASVSGVDVPGAAFLLKDVVLEEGTLFAFSAFCRTDKPLTFQIWRPLPEGGSTHYRLVYQLRVIPSVTLQREDVYIESKLTQPCVRVQSGDRVGVYQEANPGPLVYTFNGQTPQALAYTKPNITEPFLLGDQVVFDTLTFPYDFSIAAHVQLGVVEGVVDADGMVDCPKGVLIPSYASLGQSVTRTPTGPPGATGATGPTGGVGATGLMGAKGATGPTGVVGAMGGAGTKGAAGGLGATGASGPTGEVGATGAPGERGERGAHGQQGRPGPKGPEGGTIYVMGYNGTTVKHAVTPSAGGATVIFSDPMYSLGLVAWIAALTLIVFILIIVVIAMSRRRMRTPLTTSEATFDAAHAPYSSHERLAVENSRADSEKSECWNETMRDETETIYSNDTLSRGLSEQRHSVPNFNYDHQGHVNDHNYGNAGVT